MKNQSETQKEAMPFSIILYIYCGGNTVVCHSRFLLMAVYSADWKEFLLQVLEVLLAEAQHLRQLNICLQKQSSRGDR